MIAHQSDLVKYSVQNIIEFLNFNKKAVQDRNETFFQIKQTGMDLKNKNNIRIFKQDVFKGRICNDLIIADEKDYNNPISVHLECHTSIISQKNEVFFQKLNSYLRLELANPVAYDELNFVNMASTDFMKALKSLYNPFEETCSLKSKKTYSSKLGVD